MTVEARSVWVAFTNTDLTEGRGYEIPLAVCQTRATAIRLGSKGYIMGSDCPIKKVDLVKIDDKWYAPIEVVRVISPTKIDRETQALADKQDAIIAKAKAAGLTDDDITTLLKAK